MQTIFVFINAEIIFIYGAKFYAIIF